MVLPVPWIYPFSQVSLEGYDGISDLELIRIQFPGNMLKISTNCAVFFKLDKHSRLSQKKYISNSMGKPDDFYTSVYDIPENSQSTIHNVVHDY